MKEIKVCFLSWSYESPQILLDTLIKMTPKRSGRWKNMAAITEPFEADFVVVIGGTNDKFPRERALYFGQHPISSPAFKSFEGIECLKAYPLDKYLNPGEIWVDWDYDSLMELKPPNKSKDLACIMTYQTHRKTYSDRVNFVGELARKHPNFDLYGRPEERFRQDGRFASVYFGSLGKNNPDGYKAEHLIGKEILANYRYSLEFDVGYGNPKPIPTINYLSERFYDAMLLWTMPLYYGSINAHEFVPGNSFRYVDIHDGDKYEEEINRVVSLVKSDFRERNLKEMTIARHLLLNKYQTFAYTYEKIKEFV